MSETCCALIPFLLLRLRFPPMLYLFCGFATRWSWGQESLAGGALPSDGELWADVPRDGPGLEEPKDGRGVTRLESHSDTLSCAVVVLPVASPLLAACASLVRSTTKCSLHPRSSKKSSLKLQSCVSQLVQPILTDRSTCRQHTYRVHDFSHAQLLHRLVFTCCQSVQSHIDLMHLHSSSHEAHCLRVAQKHSHLIAQCRTPCHI